jgi:putative RNA 2'-phosphotransferase
MSFRVKSRAHHISKLLSLVLRHQPERMSLTLDGSGWALVSDVLRGFTIAGTPLTHAELEEVVRTSDKQRFAISADGAKIRANQGHSVDVDLGFEPTSPPSRLFHGTVPQFLESIRAQGLVRGARHHVHLSASRGTASRVGQRRGRPVVLEVNADAMTRAGHTFFLSENGVWLTDHVPVAFLVFPVLPKAE